MIKMKTRLLPFVLLVFSACSPDSEQSCTKEIPSTVWTSLDQTKLQSDIQAIDNYLDSKSITAVEDPSGLRYVITQAGSGEGPCLESRVSVKYTGKFFSNENIFDTSAKPPADDPVSFSLTGVITGWQIGFLKLNRGTKATLYIPSGLAYGPSGYLDIPPNAILIFDVELIAF